MKVIGIDFGTTNSVVAVYEKGIVKTLKIKGHSITPSVVSWRSEDKKIVVGHPAKKRILINPKTSIVSNKKNMGNRDHVYEIFSKQYTPVDIASYILSYLVDCASDELGERIKHAVITVPAYFNQNQKEDTKFAAENAGLHVLQLQAEPTAAAIAYGFNQEKDQVILVYDFGGGTFDVSILEVKGNNYIVKAVGGDTTLGGYLFDTEIKKYILEQLKAEFGAQLFQNKSSEISKFHQELIELSEQAKIDLSDSKKSEIYLPSVLGKGSFECEIKRSDLKQLLQPILNKTVFIINQTLHKANITLDEINRIVCVGGTTKSPIVKDTITENFRAPHIAENVDEIVAKGAALTANNLMIPMSDTIKSNISKPIALTISNVTPYNLGIRVKKMGKNDYFETLIKEQTPIPTSYTKDFKTVRNNQRAVEVAVFQGDRELCSDNIFIGGFILENIPKAKAGKMNVQVTFRMDSSDILNVSASCRKKQKEFQIHVDKVADISALNNQQSGQVDIAFLIDTSGSMSRELDGIKQSCTEFADHIKLADIDCRLGLIDFAKVPHDKNYNYEVFKLVSNPRLFQKSTDFLKIGRLGGSGCYVADKETLPVFRAVKNIFNKKNRLKILIFISDEVGSDVATDKIIKIMSSNEITVHVVGVPGNNAHKHICDGTNGKFWDIFDSRKIDFSLILQDIAKEIALTC